MGTGGWSFIACLGLCLLVVLSSPEPAEAADRRVHASGAHPSHSLYVSMFVRGGFSCKAALSCVSCYCNYC